MAIVQVGKLKLQVEEEGTRREYIEGLIGQIEEHVRWVVARCIEEALEGEVDKLLGRGWYERRRRKRRRRSQAHCKRCGSQDPQDFRRDGHYRRYLDTCWGRIQINVPQVECVCEGWVQLPFKTLRSRQRIWDDLEGEIRERYGWGMSLRWIKECLDARFGSSVSLRKLNGCVRWQAHRLRTNSLFEREFRTCRRRLAAVVLFHSPVSPVGLAATIHQWLVRRTARRTNALPHHWHLSLERALADAVRFS